MDEKKQIYKVKIKFVFNTNKWNKTSHWESEVILYENETETYSVKGSDG